MIQLLPKLYPTILFLLGVLFFVPFLGVAPLFDGGELHHAEAAREMLVTNTFGYAQLNFLPDYVTGPLLPWLQALSMRVFGVADNAELAARLPSALMAILTLLTLFFIGRKKHDARFGLLWALSYLGSVTPFILAKSALPATTGYFFMFLGALCLVNVVTEKTRKRTTLMLLGGSVFFGLELLATGSLGLPLMFMLLILIMYWRSSPQSRGLKIKNSLLIFSLPIIVTVIGLVSVPYEHWSTIFLAPNSGRYLYGWVIGLTGMLTVFTLSSRYWRKGRITTMVFPEMTFPEWMYTVATSAIVLIVFEPSALLLSWFPLSYLATYHIHQFLRGEQPWDTLNTYLLMVGGIVVGLLMILVPVLGMHPDWLARLAPNPFWAGVAEAPVYWAGWEWIIGAAMIVLTVMFTLLIRRKVFPGIIGFYLSTAVCTLGFAAAIVPKIEQYTQGPLIDFCEAKWTQPVYVQTTFTSYAPLFYTRKQPPIKPESRKLYWLTNGPVDQPTYIITTATDAAMYRYNPNLELVSEPYGYVIFARKQYR